MPFYLENIKDSTLMAQIDQKLGKKGKPKSTKSYEIFGLKPRLGTGNYREMKEIDKSKLSEEGLSEYEYMMKTLEKENKITDIGVCAVATTMYGLLGASLGFLISEGKKPLKKLIITAGCALITGTIGFIMGSNLKKA